MQKHIHITAKHHLLNLKIREMWDARNLIWLLTVRTFQVSYKQTILGPMWLLINPLLASLFQILLFGHIAKLSSDGIPQLLFYFSGNTIWQFFSGTITANASVFSANAHLFGKIYFPRLVMPATNLCTSFLRFCIQFIFLLILLGCYMAASKVSPHWTAWILLPFLLFELGILGTGIGIIISSVTVKYRDLSVLVGFAMQLWMYVTPVVYPFSTVPSGLKAFISWNPATWPVELYRYALLGTGTLSLPMLAYSLAVTVLFALSGIIVFNKVERTFVDLI